MNKRTILAGNVNKRTILAGKVNKRTILAGKNCRQHEQADYSCRQSEQADSPKCEQADWCCWQCEQADSPKHEQADCQFGHLTQVGHQEKHFFFGPTTTPPPLCPCTFCTGSIRHRWISLLTLEGRRDLELQKQTPSELTTNPVANISLDICVPKHHQRLSHRSHHLIGAE